jgi:Outer membrane protein beta-barrel domain
MKKILFAAIFIIINHVAAAQDFWNSGGSSITFGLMGGTNFAEFNVSSPHKQNIGLGFETPFSLGLNADFKINDFFSIRPGAFYSGKGGTLTPDYTDSKGNLVLLFDDYKLYYLEIPVDFIGHLPVGDGANFFFGAGPYYARGYRGTNTIPAPPGAPIIRKIPFGPDGDFKSDDYGVTSVIGYQAAKGWSVSVNLDYGLQNILEVNNTGFDATGLKTIAFYISIGQSF